MNGPTKTVSDRRSSPVAAFVAIAAMLLSMAYVLSIGPLMHAGWAFSGADRIVAMQHPQQSVLMRSVPVPFTEERVAIWLVLVGACAMIFGVLLLIVVFSAGCRSAGQTRNKDSN